MLDRTTAPAAGPIAFDGLPEVEKQDLSFGSIYWLRAGDQPVVRIEIVLQSGIWFESQKSLSWLTAKMLAEGSKNKSARQVSQGFESLGAFIEIDPGFDDVSITVYGLRKNFEQVIVLLNEMFNESIFPEREFGILVSNRKDQIQLNDRKNSQLASKKMREAIYGASFPYGQCLQPEDVSQVNLTMVKDYYGQRLFHQPTVYLCGDVDQTLVDAIVGQLHIPSSVEAQPTNQKPNSLQRELYVPREGSLQSSIRMAWFIPDKNDEHYFHYLIANNLLGGYFGSRLMKNIREEKGYTYGIHAYPIHLRHSAFGLIATDVMVEHTRDTLSEIRLEIDRIINDPIPDSELEILTNYLAGSFLVSLNTPFQLMDKFKKIQTEGLAINYYEQYFEALRSIEAGQIKKAVEKYFDPREAFTAIVGLDL